MVYPPSTGAPADDHTGAGWQALSRDVSEVVDLIFIESADMPYQGRPDFIPAEQFRAYLTISQMSKTLSVGGVLGGSYLSRRDRLMRPVKSITVQGRRLWRPLDVVACARADQLSVAPPPVVEWASNMAALNAELERLKNERDALVQERAHELYWRNVALELTGKTLLRPGEIARAAIPTGQGCGVYFLLLEGEVVYVGQSVNVPGRVRDHRHAKVFDSYAYIPCKEESLDVLESLYIHYLQPSQQGRNVHDGHVSAPVRLDDLVRIAA